MPWVDKFENLRREIEEKKLDVVELCEALYDGCSELANGEVNVIFSSKVKGQNEVAILVGKIS